MRKRGLWIVLGALVLLALTTASVWAAPFLQGGSEPTVDALWVTLAPLLAIATSVERVLEIVWDRWERAGVWPNRTGVAAPKAPEYVSKKKIRSHWLGTLIAFVAVGLTNVRLFRLLGFDVLFSSSTVLFDAGVGGIFDDFNLGTLIDWALTSFGIGWGGTELTHSIVEGLVKGRNLWKEMKEVQAGERSLLDVELFREHVVPQLAGLGVDEGMLRRAFEELDSAGVSVDTFIGGMTTGKVEDFLGQLEAREGTAEAAREVRRLLEGVPPEKQVEIPNVLALLTAEQRKRFLGA